MFIGLYLIWGSRAVCINIHLMWGNYYLFMMNYWYNENTVVTGFVEYEVTEY